LYTATSSPGGITGTLAQAGSGTITVTGLSAGASYTFTVRATNSAGQGPASGASNSITTQLPAIGSAYAGGFFAGQISTTANGVATHNLVVGAKSTAQEGNTELWKNSETSTPGADSFIDGAQNTADMVADGSSAVYPSAHFCNNLVTGGFSDWYMPAKNELEVCYFNLKPSTTSNNTSSGINTNAVPSRGSNYTAGTPARTSVAIFQTGGAEAFDANIYWSSTESTASLAWSQYFSTGQQTEPRKDFRFLVRAIRRVPL